MKLYLIVLIVLFIWFSLGFIGFIIEAKKEKFMQFDKNIRKEFLTCISYGLVTFIIFVGLSLIDWFNHIMDKLLHKINSI